MTDPLDRADKLDDLILKALRAWVFWRRVTLAGGALLLVALVVLAALILRTTHDTNDAVAGQVVVLQERVVELEATVADYEAIVDQALVEIERLALQVVELGGDPGEIIIRPPEDTEQGDP